MRHNFFISSLNNLKLLWNSFWLHLSILVKMIENLICSSKKQLIISKSIFCGLILQSINKKVICKLSLDVRNCCVKSNHHFLSFSQDLAYQYHGKSTNTKDLLIKKKLNNFVFHGIFELLARSLTFTNILIKEDFPTLERPKNANSGIFKFGHWFISTTLLRNSAEVIFINSSQ